MLSHRAFNRHIVPIPRTVRRLQTAQPLQARRSADVTVHPRHTTPQALESRDLRSIRIWN